MLGGIDKVKTLLQPNSKIQTVKLNGKVLCLPHKDDSKTTTLTCAIGLKTTDGKYYGLSSSSNVELSAAAGTDKKVEITGNLQPQTDATYKMDGIIAVDHFQFAN
jgi:hypothetical protein